MIKFSGKRPAWRIVTMTLFIAAAAAIHWTAKNASLHVDIELLTVGEIAPDFNLKRVDGRDQNLSSLNGTVVWIIFGRTDNDASRVQLEEARRVADEYRGEEFSILFLAEGEPFKQVEEFLASNGAPAALLFDVAERIGKKYNVSYWPTSYIVDRTGRIVGGQRGVWRSSDRTLNRIIRAYLDSSVRKTVKTPAPESTP